MKKILVPVDGSDNSKRALIEAKKLAEYTGGEVTIFTVVENLNRYPSIGNPPIASDYLPESDSKEVLKDSLTLFEDFQGEVNTKLTKGNPADEILREAESGEYDLILMGSRGLGAFSRAILGSVCNKVLNHSEVTVSIVK